MTMDFGLDLTTHRTVRNFDDLPKVPGVYEDNVQADVGLRITRASPEEGYYDFILFGPLVTGPDLNQNGVSRRDRDDMFAKIEDCRKVWKNVVVDKTAFSDDTKKHWIPFQSKWDFQNEPQWLKAAAPQLALAGERLFRMIFESKCNNDLKNIGATLRRVLSSQACYLAITSSTLFVPWGMLYTHPVGKGSLLPDGTNYEKEGFWGYQHIVQQNPKVIKPKDSIRADGEVAILSVNFDDRLAESLGMPIIAKHIEEMSALAGIKGIRRKTKVELQTGLTEGRAHLERVLYFYCHGRGSSEGDKVSTDKPRLVLTDDEVTAADFEDWANLCECKVPIDALIFINACQGGQMQTMFYLSFAVELLRQGAAGLVGAQIDVPAVFGVEYGLRVFSTFFAKGKGRIRMGPLLREINRAMWDTHKNPLGLVYSLYRGVDCFIDWPKADGDQPA
jgi:hypothetical protein